MFFHMTEGFDGLHENRRSSGIAVETRTDPAGPNEWRRLLPTSNLCERVKLLSISHGSLSTWLARRALPGSHIRLMDEDEE